MGIPAGKFYMFDKKNTTKWEKIDNYSKVCYYLVDRFN